MAKRNKAARGTEHHSLILASAESLGRMIGVLQRQLGVAKGTSNGSTTTKASNGSKKRQEKKRPAPKLKPKTTGKTKTKRRG
jgi:hypothetical protein